jgi:hypothetical protein
VTPLPPSLSVTATEAAASPTAVSARAETVQLAIQPVVANNPAPVPLVTPEPGAPRVSPYASWSRGPGVASDAAYRAIRAAQERKERAQRDMIASRQAPLAVIQTLHGAGAETLARDDKILTAARGEPAFAVPASAPPSEAGRPPIELIRCLEQLARKASPVPIATEPAPPDRK